MTTSAPSNHRVIHSMEFAYAMGPSQTYGRDPRLEWVVERADALRREIAELSAEEEREAEERRRPE